MHLLVLLALTEYVILGINDEIDDFKSVVIGLLPRKSIENNNEYKNILDELMIYIDTNFDESNNINLFEISNNTENFTDLIKSIYYNWGLGINQDIRHGMLHLSSGALNNNFLCALCYTYRSLLGLNLPQTCETNIRSMRTLVNLLAKSFLLFERKEGLKNFINNFKDVDESYILKDLMGNLDEISRYNIANIHSVFTFYFTSSHTRTPQLTKKIYDYLSTIYQLTGSHDAAAYMGFLYIEGNGVIENNYEKAMEYFEIAYKYGIPYSYLGLGVLYFYGLGVEKDYNKSFSYFVQANRSGLHEASTYLGICYLMGLGTIPDSRISYNLIMNGANKGYLLALYLLANMQDKGLGVFHSCKYSIEVLLILIEHKLLRKYISIAVEDYHHNYINRSLFKLLIFSEMGSVYALQNAAYLLDSTNFYYFTKNISLKNSFLLWKYASLLGNPYATIKVGDCYFYGNGVTKDYKDAFDHYQSAAASYHDPVAMFNIGYMYEYGLGVDSNFETAARFYSVVTQLDIKSRTLISFALLKVRLKSTTLSFINFFRSSYISIIDYINHLITVVISDRETFIMLIITIIIASLCRFNFQPLRM